MADFNNFWTAATVAKDPKRGFRFQVTMSNLDGMLWYAKKADRPTLSLTEAKHDFLNHSFYWPARAEWSEVGLTLVDPVSPDVAASLMSFLSASGYKLPAGTGNQSEFSSISKKGSIDATGNIQIDQIDEAGNPVESWLLKNAWIKEVDFSELDYSNDDLSEVTLKIRYDWAVFSGGPSSGVSDLFKI